jgi:hypothetical protein
MTELRVELSGEEAKFGTVPAADVAVLIMGVERALSRAASVKLGRPKMTTGRYEQVIAQSVRLRLRALEEGSIVPVFEIPEALPLDDGALEVEVASLGDAALGELLAAADPQSSPHPVRVAPSSARNPTISVCRHSPRAVASGRLYRRRKRPAAVGAGVLRAAAGGAGRSVRAS